jgi:hypothetical protein
LESPRKPVRHRVSSRVRTGFFWLKTEPISIKNDNEMADLKGTWEVID